MENQPKAKRLSILPILFIASFGFIGGFFLGDAQNEIEYVEGVYNIDEGKPKGADFALFWEAWDTVQERYVNADDLNFENMVYGAISGMVNSLDDPHSVFMTAEEANTFLDDVSGTFEGIGIEIAIRDNQLRVVAPLEGTPAKRVGLRAGDTIVGIEGESTQSITIEEAITKIRGPKGTTVNLTILRPNNEELLDFAIERGVIEVPSVELEMVEGNIAHISLNRFGEKTTAEFNDIASRILSSDAEGIVLDLRNNPGGYLSVTPEIAGWFLERGAVVVIEDLVQEGTEERFVAEGNAALIDIPLVVLINEGSASASEILAGALQDNRNVLLVGQRSFGKGSVQELQQLSDGSVIKLTIANWRTPSGDLIGEEGIAPDIEVEMIEEDYLEERDPQLERAIEAVRNL